jgi:tRNA A-37 threonylcarbamoyl transferase component Bud32
MMEDPDRHNDIEKTVRLDGEPEINPDFIDKTVRLDRQEADADPDFIDKTVRLDRQKAEDGDRDDMDSYFGEHISPEIGRKLSAALERTRQFRSGNGDGDDKSSSAPDEPGYSGGGIGELLTEVCRNIVSGIAGTRVSDWNETIYEENEPIDPVATDDEVSGENFDDLDRHVRLQDEIARGGQACISRGLDRCFHRIIAVKSLHDKLKDKQDYRRAFISEAKVSAQLEHPAIIPVYGIYEDGKEGLHLTMKLIRGRTLKEYLERSRLHYRKMPRLARKRHERILLWKRLDIFQRVCEAIAYVHYRNVIHRDLKPENIMIGNFNETYVMDWGIAEYQKHSNSTWSGKIAGTLQYIAPEIINKQPYDERSDIFLLGLILYEVTFLKQAYAPSQSKEEAIYKAQHCLIEPYSHHFKCRVDKDLKMIIAKAIAPDPAKRYQSVKDLEKDLKAFNLGNEVSANPDNVFSRLLRKVRLHYKMLLFFSMVLLFSFTALIALALHREVDFRRLSAKKDRAMAEVYSRGLYSCSRFDRQFRDYEYLLSTIASEAALLYKADRVQNVETRIYTLQDLKSPETAPPDYTYSPMFQEKISMDYAIFIYPGHPGPPQPEYVRMMSVLYLLKDGLRAAVVDSLPGVLPENTDAAEANQIIRNVSKPSISRVYAGFQNGLHITYPSRASVNENYDPRDREWYKAALKTPRQAIWSSPYVDSGERKDIVITCARAIVDNFNRPLGVAGADIVLGQLLKILNETGNTGVFVKNKFLVDDTGRVIADSTGKLLATRVGDDRLEFNQFPYAQFLPQMWEERNGWLFSEEDGVDYLYFYLEIESLHWLYIERIDFNQLLELY